MLVTSFLSWWKKSKLVTSFLSCSHLFGVSSVLTLPVEACLERRLDGLLLLIALSEQGERQI